MKSKYILLLLYFIFFSFESCKTVKFVNKKKYSKNILLNHYKHRPKIYSYFAKFLLNYSDLNLQQNISLNGTIKINQDSMQIAIFLPLGITAFEAFINEDSIWLYTPLQNKYYVQSLDSLSNFSIFNNELVIKLLTADLYTIPSPNKIEKYSFKLDSLLLLEYRKPDPRNSLLSIYFHRLTFDKTLKLYNSWFYYYPNYSDFKIYYNSYKDYKIKNKLLSLPDKIQMNYTDLHHNYNVYINLKKIKINDKVKIHFKIPKTAKKVPFNSIFNF